eukprot:2462432-Pleurochrysis_carterae.AAC.5
MFPVLVHPLSTPSLCGAGAHIPVRPVCRLASKEIGQTPMVTLFPSCSTLLPPCGHDGLERGLPAPPRAFVAIPTLQIRSIFVVLALSSRLHAHHLVYPRPRPRRASAAHDGGVLPGQTGRRALRAGVPAAPSAVVLDAAQSCRSISGELAIVWHMEHAACTEKIVRRTALCPTSLRTLSGALVSACARAALPVQLLRRRLSGGDGGEPAQARARQTRSGGRA